MLTRSGTQFLPAWFIGEIAITGIAKCIYISDLQLPRCKPTTAKCYWNDELTSLKNDSIVAHDFWKLNGSPRTGPIFNAKKDAYYKYKLHLKKSKCDLDQKRVDMLNENLVTGDQINFGNLTSILTILTVTRLLILMD